ncbi:GAF and ANTAR domain-containing protein [Nocardia sp. NPDC056000]|uniref:GAF and ANTAR domain-containing protein n=1 Tax=Nocardia sp. NPDC056000 TaxID=3345674 RepID=UPI0035DBC9EA
MPYDSEAFLRALSRFARLLPTDYDMATALDELVDAVMNVLELAGAGVSLESAGSLRFVTAPNPAIAAIEQCQETTQQGPCVAAFRSGRPAPITDLAERVPQWPEYTAVAARHGLRAAAGIPMRLGENSIGAVNLYDSKVRAWHRTELEAACVLADMATGYLVNADKLTQLHQLSAQLQHALDSRVIIEQAKGMIATRNDIPMDEAFQLIRRYARTNQLHLRAVAHAIVEGGLRISPEDTRSGAPDRP